MFPWLQRKDYRPIDDLGVVARATVFQEVRPGGVVSKQATSLKKSWGGYRRTTPNYICSLASALGFGVIPNEYTRTISWMPILGPGTWEGSKPFLSHTVNFLALQYLWFSALNGQHTGHVNLSLISPFDNVQHYLYHLITHKKKSQ